MQRKLVSFWFGEYLCQVAILLGDFRSDILRGSIDGRQVFGKGSDRIDM
jgi:hypothetical protein